MAILVGAALRFYHLGANSLWIDEFATLDIARHSLTDIPRLSSSENFIPPLYFVLVHSVLRVLGDSEVSLRLLSALAGIGTIPIVWLLTAVIARDRTVAHVAAGLLAANPLHLWYSQEARPYALLLLFGCCALLAFARAVESASLWNWIAFWVCATLAILVHTTGIVFPVIAWTWGLWSPNRERLLRPLLGSSLAIGLTCAPFFFGIAHALREARGAFHSPPRPITGLEIGYTLLTYVGGYSFGPAPRDIQKFGAWTALWAHSLESLLAGTVLLGLMTIAALKWRRAPEPWFTVLLAVPLGFIFLLAALSGKAYSIRYTLPSLIGFLGIMSVAVNALGPRSRTLGLAALFGLALWADAQWFWLPRYWKEDSRALVSWLRDKLPPGATVAVAPGYQNNLLEYYASKAGAEFHFRGVPPDSSLSGDTPPDALVLTRLHHVPNWRKFKADFVHLSGRQVVEGQVAGYEMLVRSALHH